MVDPVAVHEGRALGPGKLHRDLASEPTLDIEGGIVEHRLARGRIGVELARRRGDLGEVRRVGRGPPGGLADPARRRAAGGDELASRRQCHRLASRLEVLI